MRPRTVDCGTFVTFGFDHEIGKSGLGFFRRQVQWLERRELLTALPSGAFS